MTPVPPSSPRPPHLLVLGLGYSARAVAALLRRDGWDVTGTSRDPAAAPPSADATLIHAARAPSALTDATHLLASAAPDEGGDPFLRMLAPALADPAAAPRLRWIGYLSTTGVYGDRGGGWVDENTVPAPTGPRGARRLEAERAWTAVAGRRGIPLDLFRLAGIYGPGRSVLDDVRVGRARRVDAPGHCFGRIHLDDIAAAITAAINRPPPPGAPRISNLSDDLPAESADVVAEAARLLHLPPPPLVPFSEASRSMGPMGLSFWRENRKVSSRLTREQLRLSWRHPSFREGLRAILLAERGFGAGPAHGDADPQSTPDPGEPRSR